MPAFKVFQKKKFLEISGLVFLCLVLNGCSSLGKGNPNSIDDYLPGLFSEAEFLTVNDFPNIDPNESFTLLFDSTGFKDGDSDKSDRASWGEAQNYFPEQCMYENFWSSASVEVTGSKNVKGLAVNFRSINISVEDFMRSKASVLGQYVLPLDSEELASSYFTAIGESLAVCAKGVRAKKANGSLFEVGVKTAPSKNFKYYQSTDVLIRSSQDGLIALDVFVKTKFSIVFYKIFVNDLNLPSKSSWSALNSLLNDPIRRICLIEQCEAPIIEFESISSFNPSGLLVSKPGL
jgi:hypothetical protein